MDCISGIGVDNKVHVQIVRDGVEQASAICDSAGDAIRWATEREQTFMQNGWTVIEDA